MRNDLFLLINMDARYCYKRVKSSLAYNNIGTHGSAYLHNESLFSNSNIVLYVSPRSSTTHTSIHKNGTKNSREGKTNLNA